MKGWFSGVWEASWRPFQYFNLYRLVLAGIVLLTVDMPPGWLASTLHLASGQAMLVGGAFYMALVGLGLLASMRWQVGFNFQLSFQILLDVLAIGCLMYVAGGVSSGLGTLLLVSLATASLVGRGRLVLFYAALATLTTLSMQVLGVVFGRFDSAGIVQAGLLSAGFFATAILARLLGQRVMVNEELARQRGVSLENQERISQRVIERMQDGVLVVDGDGVIQQHNPVAQEMLALNQEIHPGLAESCPQLAQGLLRWLEGLGPPSIEFGRSPGGNLRARFERTASSAGEVLVFLEDLGRIQARAQQLKLAALGRLTASIAHEIRNPLSAIGHAGELLKEERRGETQDRLLKILADNVARLDRIVADVLELGRRDRIQPEQLDLLRFCQQFIDSFEAAQRIDPTIIRLEVDAKLSLHFDRNHLFQILWNLLSNAVRHSRGTAASVRLVGRAGSLAGGVELHVIDDGGGVSESVRAQIFEPFFTTRHDGTGLGLFIARELSEANGATLDLVQGAEFGHFVLSGRSDPCPLPEASAARAES